jgi:hypothetical protein
MRLNQYIRSAELLALVQQQHCITTIAVAGLLGCGYALSAGLLALRLITQFFHPLLTHNQILVNNQLK